MGKNIDEDKMYELVTIEEDLQCVSSRAICKEFIKEKTVVIPCQKPKVEQISKIMIKPVITSFKTISTLQGPKIIFEGKLIEKIFYVADNPEQSVHAAKFITKFCNFIKLPKRTKQIKDVKVNIEDVLIQLRTKKKINQCILLIVCVIPDKCRSFSDC